MNDFFHLHFNSDSINKDDAKCSPGSPDHYKSTWLTKNILQWIQNKTPLNMYNSKMNQLLYMDYISILQIKHYTD